MSAGTGVVKWQDPPKRPRAKSPIAQTVDALRENPGRWALIREDIALSQVTRWRKDLPSVEFKSRTRPGDNNRGDVWARWVGEVTR